jgi:hypothetical protein
MDLAINYLAVLVAAGASFFIGWIWYGPLFGKRWMQLRGLDPALMGSAGMPFANMAVEFVSALVVAYVLAHFVVLLNVTTWATALQLAFWLWLGFQATLLLGPVLWEKMSLKLYCLNAGRWLVTLVVMSVILGFWH